MLTAALGPACILPARPRERVHHRWALNAGEDAREGDEAAQQTRAEGNGIAKPQAGQRPRVLHVTVSGSPGNPSCASLRAVP